MCTPNSTSTPADGRTAPTCRRGADVRPRRIALYSHDTMGIGHLRRNLLIAQAAASSGTEPVILLIAGAREAAAFALPPGVDCLTLPALCKGESGAYQSRCLNVSINELIGLRAQAIRAALEAFEPDLLIVDKVPRGAVGELDPALEALHRRGDTRCVLGLRDVLDDPAAVRGEWSESASEEAVRDHYDAVWVYGDRAVYDVVQEYHLSPAVAAKVRYAGYLDPRFRAGSPGGDLLPELGLPRGRLVLCVVGGGQDGARVAEAFADTALPPDATGVVLTGPFMPAEVRQRLHARAKGNPRLRVLEFLAEPAPLLRRADRVIAMGGYNTVCELLAYEKRALVVPRVRPRREQLIRAERLRDRGLLDVLHPDDVSPRALGEWLARDLGPPHGVHERIDFNGVARLPRLLEELLATTPCRGRQQHPERRRHHAAL